MSYTNIASWNCRGAGGKSFVAQVNDLIRRHNLGILVIVEPRISGLRADVISKRIQMDSWFRQDPTGFSGGVWFFGIRRVSTSEL